MSLISINVVSYQGPKYIYQGFLNLNLIQTKSQLSLDLDFAKFAYLLKT